MRPPPAHAPSVATASFVLLLLVAPATTAVTVGALHGTAAAETAPASTATGTGASTPIRANHTATPATDTATPTDDSTGKAPDVVLSNLTAPVRVRAGDEVTVAATATNRGANGSVRLEYSLAGSTAASRHVDLAAGESTRVRFRVDLAAFGDRREAGALGSGTYVHGVRNATGAGPADRLRVTPDVDLRVRSFEAPPRVLRGDEYVVIATVANPSGESFTRTVRYRFDGETVVERAVTVPGNGTETVAVAVSVAAVEAVVGRVENGTTHDHAVVVPGGASDGDAVRIRSGPSADAGALAVESLDAPDDVRPGDTVRLNVTVRNVATTPFEGRATYRVDGAVVATEYAQVPVGERRRMTFQTGYEEVREAVSPLPARGIPHGVWVGKTPLERRPVTVHPPAPTPTPTPRVSPSFTPRTTSPATATATPVAPPSSSGESCERGFVTRCGGTAVGQTTLTIIGVVSSVLGMLYELFKGG